MAASALTCSLSLSLLDYLRVVVKVSGGGGPDEATCGDGTHLDNSLIIQVHLYLFINVSEIYIIIFANNVSYAVE